MQTYSEYSNHHHPHEYSFSQLETITINPIPRKNNHERLNSSIDQQRSRDRYREASPLHNLHYKYLPDDYISPEKKRDNKDSTGGNRNPHPSKENSMRTEEMFKINSKIKNILESIEQQEKRKEIYVQKYSKDRNPSVSRFTDRKDSNYVLTSNNRENLQQKTYLNDYSQRRNRNDFKTPLKDKNMNEISINNLSSKYSNLSSIQKENRESPYIRDKDYNSQLKRSSFCPEQDQKPSPSTYNLINSRYSNYSASRVKRSKTKQNESLIIKGKNVDNEIDKLQLKIQQLQKVKKTMNIDFSASKATGEPHDSKAIQEKLEETKNESKLTEQLSMKSSIIDSYSNNHTQLNEKLESSIKKAEPNQEASIGINMAKSEFYNLKEKVNQEDVQVPKILRNLTAKKKKENPRTAVQTDFNQIQSSVSEFFNTNTQTPQSISTGREVPACSIATAINAAMSDLAQQQDSSELKRLLFNLQAQIKIDEQLRRAKKWFQRWKKQSKWQELELILKRQSMWIDGDVMRQAFSVTSEEENPFYTPRDTDFTLNDLEHTFEQAEKHWANNIAKSYSRRKLEHASFTEESIDISKRGVISIQDIVRYINYELDTFYRNRDIYLIYHRLKKREVLHFQDVMEGLTNQLY